MSFSLVLSVVLLASVQATDETITNVAELTKAAYAGVGCPRPFDIRATALSRPDNSMSAFCAKDTSGTVSIHMGWNNPNRDFNPGDTLHVTGLVEKKLAVFAEQTRRSGSTCQCVDGRDTRPKTPRTSPKARQEHPILLHDRRTSLFPPAGIITYLPLKQWNEILNFEFSFQPASLAQFSLGKILKNSLAPTP